MAVSGQHAIAGGNGASHPSLEMLAAYVDRSLTAADAALVERHASACGACRATLSEVSALAALDQGEPKAKAHSFGRFRRTTTPLVASLAAAAVLLLAVRTFAPERLPGWLGGAPAAGRLSPLVAIAATSPVRFSEGRLTGGFPYAPAAPVTRGVDEPAVSPDIRIAAAEVEQRIGSGETAAEQAAIGIARLAAADWEGAIMALERAATLAPGDSRIHSDLAAAYLTTARTREANNARAREAAERALAAADPPVEALFNRAVALERLGLREAAIQAWRDYLTRDVSSPWATEARERVRALSPSTSAP